MPQATPEFCGLLCAAMVSVTVPDRCHLSSTHPLLLKNASSKNRSMEDLNTKDFILRKSQLSLHVVISSILQAEEGQGANPEKTVSTWVCSLRAADSVYSPIGNSSSTSLQAQNTSREENKTISSISSVGSTFICSEEKQSVSLVLVFKNDTFPNFSIPQAERLLSAGKL